MTLSSVTIQITPESKSSTPVLATWYIYSRIMREKYELMVYYY